MGTKGENHRAVAQRLRTQSREGLRRDVRFLPAANESRHGRRAEAICIHHRYEWGDPVRGEQRRRKTASQLREDQSETGRTKMTRALNVIPNGVRDLTIGAWITLDNLRDFISLCQVLRFAQDDRIENERRI